jgi:hypothetical protein
MKKELTDEIVCAYLPHKPLIGWHDEGHKCVIDVQMLAKHGATLANYRMCLRPLSDLTREITHNGETFEPMQRLVDEMECDAEWSFIKAIEDDWASAQGKMRFAPMSIASKLLSWHFDTFGLIDSGLAIDINTLTK